MISFNIGIYCIKNIIDNKCIYGSSKNIKKRWVAHRRKLKNTDHENIYLQRVWNKHGADSFVFELIEECAVENLFEVEQVYIDSNVGGYNIAPACGGDTLTNHPNREAIYKKISETTKNRIQSLTVKEREYLSHPGKDNPNWKGGISKKYCPICKNPMTITANICINCIDRSGKNNSFYGKKHTKESNEKNRISHTGKNNTLYNINPKNLSYTKKYKVTYPDNSAEEYFGLKIIALKFKVSITAVQNAVKKNVPKKSGPMKGILVEEIKR